MRLICSEQNDIFSPQGQLSNEIDLASSEPFKVISILKEKLSFERQQRIDKVVAHRTRKLSVAIEGVHDPHNAAAVIRTADAFGIQLVHVIKRSETFRSSRKVTQGAHKWVDLAFSNSVQEFAKRAKDENMRVFLADANASVSLDDVTATKPAVFVFGNEHDGVSDEMREVADDTFSIPMFGFAASINVSAAAAVTLSHVRRHGGGDLDDKEKAVLTARYYLRAVRAGYDIVKLHINR